MGRKKVYVGDCKNCKGPLADAKAVYGYCEPCYYKLKRVGLVKAQVRKRKDPTDTEFICCKCGSAFVQKVVLFDARCPACKSHLVMLGGKLQRP